MKYDVAVIGTGIVGLATAFQLKKKQPDLNILMIEKEDGVSQHQTGNNSGVIHSGIYYKPGSLKARNCLEGYNQLLGFCKEYGITYDICGKIIVATAHEELERLEALQVRGERNGLMGLKWLNTEELKNHEPHVSGIAGLYIPQTGIVDFKEVSAKFFSILKDLGVEFRFSEKVMNIREKLHTAWVITNKQEYFASIIVNCAGLYSDKVAKFTFPDLDVKIVPFRGEYFKIREERQYLVKNLIYPVPDPAFPFLGVHFTRMIHGGIEAGPNAVLAFAREGYKKSDINLRELMETLAWPGFQKVAKNYWQTGFGEMYRSFSKKAFTKALQRLIPQIQKEDLITGGSGVRAQACDRNGGLVDDFLIFENETAVNVCNAPSPAATSCLSIGQTISDKVLAHF